MSRADNAWMALFRPSLSVLVRGGQTTELQQEPSGSGFVYASRTTTIRGKGDDLTVEIGRMAPLQCKAKP